MNKQEKLQIKKQELQKQKEKYFNKLLEIMEEYKINAILETLDEKCKNIRCPSYSNEYYLYYITIVLTDVQTWNSLNKLFDERTQKTPKNHYKTIEDKHLDWSKLNIYEDSYKKILQNNNKLDLKRSKNLNLFIDSSDVYNKNGHENVGYGCNPKKKQTRISAVCDENKTILSLIITTTINKSPNIDQKKVDQLTKKEKEDNKVNKKVEKVISNLKKELKNIADDKVIDKIKSILVKNPKAGKEKIKKEPVKQSIIVAKNTLRHDSQTIEHTMDNLLIDFNKCKKVKLIGDKGYIRSQKDKNEILNTYNTEVIHPNRKNQKENTTNNHKKLLKGRYVIENVFAKLKRFDRICMRRERLAVTFKGFLFLATLITSNM